MFCLVLVVGLGRVIEVLRRVKVELLSIPGVVAVLPRCEGSSCYIVVFVRDREAVERVPKEVDGVPVRVVLSGEIRPLSGGGNVCQGGS